MHSARRKTIMVFLLVLVSVHCYAGEREDRVIDNLVLQYAGMLGMISLGFENESGGNASYQFLAGYVPESEAGIDIYSLGAKANYLSDPIVGDDDVILRIYAGMGFYYYFGEQYQIYDYPYGYYTHPATEWHLMPYLGMRFANLLPALDETAVYFEAGIIDAYLFSFYNNAETLPLGDVVSLAVGISIPLR